MNETEKMTYTLFRILLQFGPERPEEMQRKESREGEMICQEFWLHCSQEH